MPYKIRHVENGAAKDGTPFITSSLAVPTPHGDRIPDRERFTVHCVPDGILYRRVEDDHVSGRRYKVRRWANGANAGGEAYRSYAGTVPKRIAERWAGHAFTFVPCEEGLRYVAVSPPPAPAIPSWMAEPQRVRTSTAATVRAPADDAASGAPPRADGVERSCEACLRAAAAVLGPRMTARGYDAFARHQRSMGQRFPGSQTITTRLGRWNEAKLRAGLEANPGRPPAIDAGVCRAAIGRVWDALGREPSEREYRDVSRRAEGLPSHPTVRVYLSGSWPEIMASVRSHRTASAARTVGS